MVELLQLAIRANDKFRGIGLGDSVIKLLQYADNTNGVLRDEVSLKMLLDTKILWKNFRLRSTSKSECMGLGGDRGQKGDLFGLNWPIRPTRPGVYLTYDYDDLLR